MSNAYITVASVDQVPDTGGLLVNAGGRAIAVFRVEGSYYAIDNTCAHKGGPLAEGSVQGCVIECPWHGWGYDLKTGECTYDENVKQRIYPVRITGSDIQVEV